MATTSLWAAQQLATERRGNASKLQEAAAGAVSEASGFTFDKSRRKIELTDDLARGHYSRERVIGSSKCDVPTGLLDGRILALECKVSNGPKNGWKRVKLEVGGKAYTWEKGFGTQLVTGVVIAGVYDFGCISRAQEGGVTIFWQHNLQPLQDFVSQAD